MDVFIRLEIWEDLSAMMSETGSQSEYNKKVISSDIFVLLAYTKMGKYTDEEFERAWSQFKSAKKPAILTYLKNAESPHESLLQFKQKLSDLNHFFSPFNDSNDLWNQFNKELERLETSFSKVQPFNEYLTSELVGAIKPYSKKAKDFLNSVKNTTDWYKMSDKNKIAKNILISEYAGIMGNQLRKLISIGANACPNQKHDYIDNCIVTALRTLQILFYTLLCDASNKKKVNNFDLSDEQIGKLSEFFEHSFEADLEIAQYLDLFRCMYSVYNEHEGLQLPIVQLNDFGTQLEPVSKFYKACMAINVIHGTPEDEKYTASNCRLAEINITEMLASVSFLANYKMVSIKSIGYELIQNISERYSHRFVSLQGDSNINYADSFNYIDRANYIEKSVSTDSVLIYEDINDDYADYQKGINLFPFIIDYNALTFQDSSKICFYSSADTENKKNILRFYFSGDDTEQKLTFSGIIRPDADINELLAEPENQKKNMIDNVFKQLWDVRKTMIGR